MDKAALKGVLMTAVGVALGVLAANLVTTKLINKGTTTSAE